MFPSDDKVLEVMTYLLGAVQYFGTYASSERK